MVFDLDDTLAPEHLYLMSAFRFAEKYLKDILLPKGRDIKEGEIVTLMDAALPQGPFYYDALERWLESKGITPEEIMPELVAAVHDHKPDNGYALDSLTSQVLATLRSRGIRMALITDGRSNTQRRKIEALGLYDYIHPELIFISGEQGADKTKPDSFIKVVRSFPEAASFTYTGDNPAKDFEHPNLLGWETYCLMASPEGKNIFMQPDRPYPFGARHKIFSLENLLLP